MEDNHETVTTTPKKVSISKPFKIVMVIIGAFALLLLGIGAGYLLNSKTCFPDTVIEKNVLVTTTSTPSPENMDEDTSSEGMEVDNNFEVISETSTSKTYKLFDSTIEVPNTYEVSKSDYNDSIIISPLVEKNLPYNNSIAIFSYMTPLAPSDYHPWYPSLDSDLTINGINYHKLASRFGEGGNGGVEKDGTVNAFFYLDVTYTIFTDHCYIRESINIDTIGAQALEYMEYTTEEILAKTQAQELVTEMDNILKTLKPLN